MTSEKHKKINLTLRELLETLNEYGVTQYQTAEITLHLQPKPKAAPLKPETTKTKEQEAEELLFYSAAR